MLIARIAALRVQLVCGALAVLLAASVVGVGIGGGMGGPTTATDEIDAAGAPVRGASPRIGLQVGHWRSRELPNELARLRTATGGSGGGVREVDVNLAVTERLAERLRARGYTVDVLPSTVPPGYQADLFLAIHADATTSSTPRGFKLARGRSSMLPRTDDALIAAIRAEYGRATGLPWSPSITRNMTGYYAFSGRRFQHAIAPTTPSAILEMGYLTNAADRAVLTGGIDRVVDGVLRGIVRFVDGRPPAEGREQLVQPAPLDCRRFDETGQEVCGPFLRAWEARGGLVRFGLPITAEIEEGDPATGKERTVQYFERARFDHVPDRVGTLDEIRLGMVGSAAIADRADESPFAPIAAFADTDERRFFPETGHSLAGGFKQHWSATGGLALYGLPISEEFQEHNPQDGRTYTVQYFERARFEHHPEHAGTPHEIQLGHLGRHVFQLTQSHLQPDGG